MKLGSTHFDQNQLNALIFGFLVLLLPVAVYLASNVRQNLQTKASPTAVIWLEIDGSEPSEDTWFVLMDQDMKVNVMVQSGSDPDRDRLESVKVQIKYDPEYLSIVNPNNIQCGSIPPANFLPYPEIKKVEVSESPETGTVLVWCKTTNERDLFPANSTNQVASFTFRTLKSTPTTQTLSIGADTSLYKYSAEESQTGTADPELEYALLKPLKYFIID